MSSNAYNGAIEASDERKGSSAEFHFTLKLSVESVAALWSAAARRSMDESDLNEDDIAETFGPPEDPSVEDCLMALALPLRIPGCTMLEVDLRPIVHETLTERFPARRLAQI
ncbi:hypothetical protein PX699_09340 [Sphingobium sp. H39-3-25]|uniref:hypothetical protein n=1 Tax=Sphingobium arseniciresistens TaxID=3030834 RepID=UPI0023B9B478|nr:hypothetical protein [Sphingobium arseniciresistens]